GPKWRKVGRRAGGPPSRGSRLPPTGVTGSRTLPMDGQLDFTAYSDQELREALETIDGPRYPHNLASLKEEIGRRGPSGEPGVEPSVPVPAIKVVNQTLVELVDIDALPTRDQFTVFWGFVWRSVIMLLATFVVGFVLSMIAAVFMGLLGLVTGFEGDNLQSFQKAVGLLAAFAIGMALTWHFLRWLFQSKMGRYRVLLG